MLFTSPADRKLDIVSEVTKTTQLNFMDTENVLDTINNLVLRTVGDLYTVAVIISSHNYAVQQQLSSKFLSIHAETKLLGNYSCATGETVP